MLLAQALTERVAGLGGPSLGRRLLEPDFPESERRTATVLFIAGSFVYISSIGLALISPYVFLAFQAALAAYYALDPISRRVRR